MANGNTTANHYDAVFVITDGNPTLWGNEVGNASYNTLADTEMGIFSANIIRNQGTKVVALGVGAGIQGDSYRNLRAISGPDVNDDYYLVTDWGNLKETLSALASANCEGKVSIHKQSVDTEGVALTPNPATSNGLTFSLEGQGLTFNDTSTSSTTLTTGHKEIGGTIENGWTPEVAFTLPSASATGTITITEPPGGRFEFEAASCSVDGVPIKGSGGQIELTNVKQDSIVTCGFENAYRPIVKVDKEWTVTTENADGSTTGPVTVSGATLPGSNVGGATDVTAALALAPRPPVDRNPGVTSPEFGVEYVYNFSDVDEPLNVSETVGTLPANCTATAPIYSRVGTAGADINSSTGVTGGLKQELNHYKITNPITCTAPVGALTIVKAFEGVPAGSGAIDFGGGYQCLLDGETVASGTWSRNGAGAATLTPATGTLAPDNLPAGATCTATETSPTGSAGLPNASWSWGPPTVSGGVTIVADQTQTITVTNRASQGFGSFAVTKNLVGTADADLTYAGTWQCAFGDDVVASGDWGPIVAGGTWNSPSSIPLGAACSVLTETRPGHPVAGDHSYQWDGDADLGSTVTAAAQSPTVTVTNTTKRVPGSVTWSKVGPGGAVLGGSTWLLTGPGTGVGGVVVTDCVSGTCETSPFKDQDARAGHFQLTGLAWGTYTLVEQTAPPGYEPSTTPHKFTIAADAVNVPVGPIDNRGVPVEVDKAHTSSVMDADGVWTVQYNITVSNSSSTAAVYSLTDTLKYGDAIDVLTASWVGPASDDPRLSGDWDDPGSVPTTTLVTDRTLAGNSSEVFTVTVTARVPVGEWLDPSIECVGGENPGAGGFLNEATATYPGGESTDEDCDTPTLPEIVKTLQGVEQDETDPTSWTVKYLVTVTSGQQDTYYTLSDVPGFPTGVTLGAGTAQLMKDGELVGPVMPIPANGGVISEDISLAAGAEHIYVITWQATIEGTIPADQAVCEPGVGGKGFFNEATITVGGEEVDDDACGPIEPLVMPNVDKQVVSTTQDDAGLWNITYDITVALPEGEPLNPNNRSAKYDLSDTLDFGGDIEIQSAEWSLDGGAVTAWEDPMGSPTEQLASGKAIAAGVTHTYTVSVVALVTTEAFENGTDVCEAQSGPEGGGFLNRALLTSGGQEVPAEDCSSPVAPTLDKTGQVSVQNPDGSWSISYIVTVSNSNDEGPDVVFDLTDTPAPLPDGVTLVEGTTWTASAVGEAPAVIQGERPADGVWSIASGSLAPGAQAQYLIEANVTVADLTEGYEFGECEDVNSVGIVLPNGATVSSGGFVAEDDGCTTVLPGPRWNLVKDSVPPTGSTVNAGGSITYMLKITNNGQVPVTEALVVDDLSDVVNNAVLQLPLSEGLTLSEDGTALTWVAPEVPVGGFTTVSYTVLVNEDAHGVTLRNIATPEGPGVEPCPEGECETEHYTPKWTLEKRSNPASGATVQVGQNVKYTLTATNVSDAVVSGAKAVDDLSKVLNNATLVEPLADGLVLEGRTLTWTIPDLEPGDSVSVSYTVKVKEFDKAIQLLNVVTPEGPGGECLPGKCTTTHPGNPGGTLPTTGAQVLGMGLMGLIDLQSR